VKEVILRRERSGGRKFYKYLFDSVGYLCLVADITRIKRGVIVALNDVKDCYRVTAHKQSIYDVTAEETAAANDEEGVAVLGGHGVVRGNEVEMGSPDLSFLPDAIT